MWSIESMGGWIQHTIDVLLTPNMNSMGVVDSNTWTWWMCLTPTWTLRADSNTWTDGCVVDPTNGWVYCLLTPTTWWMCCDPNTWTLWMCCWPQHMNSMVVNKFGLLLMCCWLQHMNRWMCCWLQHMNYGWALLTPNMNLMDVLWLQHMNSMDDVLLTPTWTLWLNTNLGYCSMVCCWLQHMNLLDVLSIRKHELWVIDSPMGQHESIVVHHNTRTQWMCCWLQHMTLGFVDHNTWMKSVDVMTAKGLLSFLLSCVIQHLILYVMAPTEDCNDAKLICTGFASTHECAYLHRHYKGVRCLTMGSWWKRHFARFSSFSFLIWTLCCIKSS